MIISSTKEGLLISPQKDKQDTFFSRISFFRDSSFFRMAEAVDDHVPSLLCKIYGSFTSDSSGTASDEYCFHRKYLVNLIKFLST